LIASRSTSDEVKSALSGLADLLHNYADVHRALQMPTYSTMIEASDSIRALCRSITRARLDDDDRDIKLVRREFPLQIIRAMLEARHDPYGIDHKLHAACVR
jgi:hypothetical protein